MIHFPDIHLAVISTISRAVFNQQENELLNTISKLNLLTLGRPTFTIKRVKYRCNNRKCLTSFVGFSTQVFGTRTGSISLSSNWDKVASMPLTRLTATVPSVSSIRAKTCKSSMTLIISSGQKVASKTHRLVNFLSVGKPACYCNKHNRQRSICFLNGI